MTRPDVSTRPIAESMARRARRSGARQIAWERTPPRRRRFPSARLEGDRLAKDTIASHTTLTPVTVEAAVTKRLRPLSPLETMDDGRVNGRKEIDSPISES